MIEVIIFIFGLLVGSFLNVIIYRLHTEQSIIIPASHCPHCKKKIRWFDNVPVLSFVLLRGTCRACRQPIGWMYPAVEVITGFLFLLLYDRFDLSGLLMLWLIVSCFLIIIFVYDLKYGLILDQITIPAIIFVFFAQLFFGWSWQQLVFAGLIGGGFFAIQYFLSGGTWVGDGDIRLGILMGVLLGWQLLLLAFFLAYVLGAAVGIVLIITRKKKLSSQIPFGTFLTGGTILSGIYGPTLLHIYFSLFI